MLSTPICFCAWIDTDEHQAVGTVSQAGFFGTSVQPADDHGEARIAVPGHQFDKAAILQG